MLPNVTEMLRSTLPLRLEPNSYVFIDGEDKPIDQEDFNRYSFQPVLRILKIRPRPFYNLRHSYISISLTEGTNQKYIAEQTGTSVQMIENHYGKYIRDDGDAPMRAYVERLKQSPILAETGTLGRNPLE
jgi:integrase